MKSISKTPLEIHRELLTNGIFQRETQKRISEAISVNQGTVSRISRGRFKRVTKSVLAICKYAQINTLKKSDMGQIRLFLTSQTELSDPEKKKLMDIIGLAVDLLERS